MKRIIPLLLMLLLALPQAVAQRGLHIDQLFGSELRNRKGSTEVLVTGREAARYGLTLFRSLTFQASQEEMLWTESLVRADRAGATSMEEARRNARLYYGFYELKAQPEGKGRYLFYRNGQLEKGSAGKLTVIYMEGTATIDELKRRFSR